MSASGYSFENVILLIKFTSILISILSLNNAFNSWAFSLLFAFVLSWSLMRNIQTNDRFVLMVLREAKALASSCILMGWVKMEDIYEPLL